MAIADTGTRLLLVTLVALAGIGIGQQACADRVSGMVRISGGLAANQLLVFRRLPNGPSVQARTDGSGRYSVFLEPGSYEVSPIGSQSTRTISSTRSPVTRNLSF